MSGPETRVFGASKGEHVRLLYAGSALGRRVERLLQGKTRGGGSSRGRRGRGSVQVRSALRILSCLRPSRHVTPRRCEGDLQHLQAWTMQGGMECAEGRGVIDGLRRCVAEDGQASAMDRFAMSRAQKAEGKCRGQREGRRSGSVHIGAQWPSGVGDPRGILVTVTRVRHKLPPAPPRVGAPVRSHCRSPRAPASPGASSSRRLVGWNNCRSALPLGLESHAGILPRSHSPFRATDSFFVVALGPLGRRSWKGWSGTDWDFLQRVGARGCARSLWLGVYALRRGRRAGARMAAWRAEGGHSRHVLGLFPKAHEEGAWSAMRLPDWPSPLSQDLC